MEPTTNFDFAFAFDNPCFSDRLLKIHVVDGTGTINKAREVHTNSVVLATQSPFFLKLFSNGMCETHSRHDFTLSVSASEVTPLINLLNFMYMHTNFRSFAVEETVRILEIADKFEVRECISHCVRQLIPGMTETVASSCLEMSSHLKEGNSIQSLLKAVTSCLVQKLNGCRSKGQNLYEEDGIPENWATEALGLSLEGIKAVLGSNELEVDLEDEVYDVAVAYIKVHGCEYGVEGQSLLAAKILPLVRFSMLSLYKLQELHEEKSKGGEQVLLAISYLEDSFALRAGCIYNDGDGIISKQHLIERVYWRKKALVLPLKSSLQVFLELEFKDLFFLQQNGRFFLEPLRYAALVLAVWIEKETSFCWKVCIRGNNSSSTSHTTIHILVTSGSADSGTYASVSSSPSEAIVRFDPMLWSDAKIFTSHSNESEQIICQNDDKYNQKEDCDADEEEKQSSGEVNVPRVSHVCKAPIQFDDSDLMLAEQKLEVQPKSYEEAMPHDNSPKWNKAMVEEMQAIYSNKTWSLTMLPQDIKV